MPKYFVICGDVRFEHEADNVEVKDNGILLFPSAGAGYTSGYWTYYGVVSEENKEKPISFE